MKNSNLIWRTFSGLAALAAACVVDGASAQLMQSSGLSNEVTPGAALEGGPTATNPTTLGSRLSAGLGAAPSTLPVPDAGAVRVPSPASGSSGVKKVGSSGAQERQGLKVTPRLEAALNWTDNIRQTSDKRSSSWAELSPAVNISSERGRFIGSFDLAGRSMVYSGNGNKEGNRSETYGIVSGAGQLALIENTLFLEGSADVNRRNSNLFSGFIGEDSNAYNQDQENRNYGAGARLQYTLGSVAQCNVRYHSAWRDSNYAGEKKQNSQLWSTQLGNAEATRLVGWGLDYRHIKTKYADYPDSDIIQNQARGTLYANLMSTFRLRFIGGHETYDDIRGKTSHSIGGGGFDWTPTPRTQISALAEKRFFGTGYEFTLSHRAHRSLWQIIGSNDITSTTNTGLYRNPLYDDFLSSPLYDVMTPEQRAEFINQNFPTLDAATNSMYRERAWTALWTYGGLRNILTLSGQRAYRKEMSSTSIGGTGIFAYGEELTTDTAAVSFSRRLSRNTTLTAGVTQQWTSTTARVDGKERDVDRTNFDLGVTRRLGKSVHGSLGYRHSRTDSELNNDKYSENAVRASLGMTF